MPTWPSPSKKTRSPGFIAHAADLPPAQEVGEARVRERDPEVPVDVADEARAVEAGTRGRAAPRVRHAHQVPRVAHHALTERRSLALRPQVLTDRRRRPQERERIRRRRRNGRRIERGLRVAAVGLPPTGQTTETASANVTASNRMRRRDVRIGAPFDKSAAAHQGGRMSLAGPHSNPGCRKRHSPERGVLHNFPNRDGSRSGLGWSIARLAGRSRIPVSRLPFTSPRSCNGDISTSPWGEPAHERTSVGRTAGGRARATRRGRRLARGIHGLVRHQRPDEPEALLLGARPEPERHRRRLDLERPHLPRRQRRLRRDRRRAEAGGVPRLVGPTVVAGLHDRGHEREALLEQDAADVSPVVLRETSAAAAGRTSRRSTATARSPARRPASAAPGSSRTRCTS